MAVLVYQNLELRWYRHQTVHVLANRLSTGLLLATDDVGRALEVARTGDYSATAGWLSGAEVDLQSASVAESAYSLALDRRFSHVVGHSTGFGLVIQRYESVAKEDRYALARSGWTPELEAELRTVASDLKQIANFLTEDRLNRQDYTELKTGAESVTLQFKINGAVPPR